MSIPLPAPRRGRRGAPSLTLLLAVLTATGACQPGVGERDDSAARGAPSVSARDPGEPPAGAGPATRPMINRAWVIFGADTVVAEVAGTADERAEGLKFRDELAPGTGMLFVFPDLGTRSFWMQDTYIPLDIAYMDASFRIVDIQQMEPLTTDAHPSAAPAMYALEVPLGWFADHGIEVGDVPEVVFGG